MDKKNLISLLKILMIPLSILAGWGFWIFLNGGIIVVLPFMIGYIYMLIELTRLKKWAFQFFEVVFLLSLFIEILFILFGVNDELLELFLIIIVFVSSIGIFVLGISTLVRKLMKKARDK